MNKHFLCCLASISLVIALVLLPAVIPSSHSQTNAGFYRAVSHGQLTDVADREQGSASTSPTDPCTHDPRGNAFGRDKRCPPSGSSGGVAKGDFNGDGFGDLAIGVPAEDVGTVTDAGSVNVIYGSANGLSVGGSGIPAAQIWNQNSPGVLDVSEQYDGFGAALASGDFNGDGFSDLAVAVPGEDSPVLNPGSGVPSVTTGAVQILFGSTSGLTSSNNQYLDGNLFRNSGDPFIEFKTSLLWGNFNNDMIGDLAIEVTSKQLLTKGNVLPDRFELVLRGSVNGLVTTNRQLVRIAGNSGHFVLAAGDFNRDQMTDLAAGVPTQTIDGMSGAGVVHILQNSAAGFTAITQSIVSAQPKEDEFLGAALATGDFNADGFSDLVVAKPGEMDNPTDRVINFPGSVNGIAPASFQNVLFCCLHTDEHDFSSEAATVLTAGDFNGDGFSDIAIGIPDADDFQVLTNTGDTIVDAGVVFVRYGQGDGLPSGPGSQYWFRGSSGIEGAEAAGDLFGFSLTAWNFGNGSQADLAIGVIGDNIVDANGTNIINAGSVNVIYGSANKLTATGDQIWHQGIAGIPGALETNDFFGSAIY